MGQRCRYGPPTTTGTPSSPKRPARSECLVNPECGVASVLREFFRSRVPSPTTRRGASPPVHRTHCWLVADIRLQGRKRGQMALLRPQAPVAIPPTIASRYPTLSGAFMLVAYRTSTFGRTRFVPSSTLSIRSVERPTADEGNKRGRRTKLHANLCLRHLPCRYHFGGRGLCAGKSD